MMANLKTKTTILLLVMQVVISKPGKKTSVYEVVEPPRTDDKKPPNNAGALPYGNPLAGNSLQNAKLHAQNQQAMFNAERIRQHRAQLQRWNKAPQQLDSYMKAYQESQESHQLALEQEQAKLNKKSSSKRPENLKHSKGPDPMKITKEDAVTKPESVRNHRSYGSVEYQQYLEPRRYKTVYVSPGPTYDQGVNIKPNGITYLDSTEPTKLYTEAVASNAQYVYPKQYSPMQNYESTNDIAVLNALLSKTPQEQLAEFNAMLQSNTQTEGTSETPLDVHYYLRNVNQNLEHYAEAPTYATYARDHEIKDHTPITETIDDIEDPNKQTSIFYSVPTAQTFVSSTGNYFNAAQSMKPDLNQVKPTYEALTYEKPLHFSPGTTGKEVYLHQSAQPTGVQHLNENGVGVSAYSEDDLQYAANYEFGYRVRDHHTGNDFGHHEATKDGKTHGHYHVLLPDGRMQKVKYSAGPSGFHADISYDHLV